MKNQLLLIILNMFSFFNVVLLFCKKNFKLDFLKLLSFFFIGGQEVVVDVILYIKRFSVVVVKVNVIYNLYIKQCDYYLFQRVYYFNFMYVFFFGFF